MAKAKKQPVKTKKKSTKYSKLAVVTSKELAAKKKALVQAERTLAKAKQRHEELIGDVARLDMVERSLKALIDGTEPPTNVKYIYNYPQWVWYPPQPWLYGQYQYQHSPTYPYGSTGVYINGGSGSWQGTYTNSNLPLTNSNVPITNTITCNSSSPVTCNSGALVGSSGTAFIGHMTAGPSLGEVSGGGLKAVLSSISLADTGTTCSAATTVTVDLSTGAEADDGPVKINELPEAIACQKGIKDWAPVD